MEEHATQIVQTHSIHVEVGSAEVWGNRKNEVVMYER